MKTKIVLLVLLMGSVLGNGLAYYFLRVCYDRHAIQRLDPLGERFKNKHVFEEKRYETVLLGDSIAVQWKIKDALNLGIGGQTSAQIRLRSDLVRDRLKGGQLIVMCGVNDIKSLPTRLDEMDFWLARYEANIKSVIANHEAHFSKIILCTTTPIFYVPFRHKLIYNQGMLEAQSKMNATIRGLESEQVRVLDAFKILDEYDGPEALSVDGVHLSARGYELLNEGLRALVR